MIAGGNVRKHTWDSCKFDLETSLWTDAFTNQCGEHTRRSKPLPARHEHIAKGPDLITEIYVARVGAYVAHTHCTCVANVHTRGTHVAHVGHICATLESRVDATVIRCGPAAAHMCHVGGLGDFYVAHLGPRVCHIWRCLDRGFSHCAHVSLAMVSICECALHIFLDPLTVVQFCFSPFFNKEMVNRCSNSLQ